MTERTHRMTARSFIEPRTLPDKAPVRPGDEITGEVEITKVREDKPITELRTRVFLSDGSVVLEGDAVCYTMPIQQ